jgi:hypothetical protein
MAALLFCCAEPLPTTPEALLGPDTLAQHRTGTFLVYSLPTRPERVRFIINWGDNLADTSQYVRGGDTVSAAHAWDSGTVYSIFARAQDEKERLSGTSPLHQVAVVNLAPLTPAGVAGPDTARQDSLVEFATVTTDPESDLLTYVFDWGDTDSTVAPGYASGDSARMLHAWPDTGRFSVRARARDLHGHETGWSPARSILIIP